MKRIAIYASSSKGHFLEWINIMYNRYYNNSSNEYYFIVPYDFHEVKNQLVWKSCEHIHFVVMSKKECSRGTHLPVFFSSFYKSKVLNKYIKKYYIDSVFVIMLVHLLPFIVFFTPKKTEISGVLYRIYYYEWKSLSILRKLIETFQFLLLANSKSVKSVLVLNDSAASSYLNRKFKTTKYKYINDPLEVPEFTNINIRKLYNISYKQNVLLHFGSLTERKGTILILQMMEYFTSYDKDNYIFIFAGKVANDIYVQFYSLIDKYTKEGVKIIVKDEFCSYSYIANCCKASDCILVPYSNMTQSSGVIGYAAYFDKPVIGPETGLLGKLIRRYKLGISTNVSIESLYNALQNVNFDIPNISKYKDMLSIEKFQDSIEKSF